MYSYIPSSVILQNLMICICKAFVPIFSIQPKLMKIKSITLKSNNKKELKTGICRTNY